MGRPIDQFNLNSYAGFLVHGGSPADVRRELAYSKETRHKLEALYQAIWKRPMPETEYASYVEKLATAWSLNEVQEALKTTYRQTVVLPVFNALSLLQ